MIITQTIKIDFTRPAVPECVSAVQGEDSTRVVKIELYAAGAPWQLPAGHDIVIRYGKPDGTSGKYDTLPDDSVAWTSEGNTVSVTLCPQMLTCPGKVPAQVCITVGDRRLCTFAFVVRVEADPSKGAIKSEPYYKWNKAFIPQTTGAQVGQYLQITKVDAAGRVIEVKPVDAPAAGGIDGDLDMAGNVIISAGEVEFVGDPEDSDTNFTLSGAGFGTDADDMQMPVAVMAGANNGDPVILTNIAPGSADSDAVNVGQLKTRLLAPIKAAVGQYIRITAVDENGVVTAVEAVDAPSGGDGSTGVYVGEEEPTDDNVMVWIPPDGGSLAVVAPDTAEVGQTIVVEEVDEGGKPTKWKAVDLPAGGSGAVSGGTCILADFTLEEDVSGFTVPLDDDPFNYSSLLITITATLLPDGHQQYWGWIYGNEKQAKVCHLNTLFDSAEERTVEVMVNLFETKLHTIAHKKSNYQWNTSSSFHFTYDIESNVYGLENVLDFQGASAVAGSRVTVEGVK